MVNGKYTMDEAIKIGNMFAVRFKISKDRQRFFKTEYGRKTAIGLFEMLMDIAHPLVRGETNKLLGDVEW